MDQTKAEALIAVLGPMPGVAVAFSGGVDSSVVAKAAVIAHGHRAVAFTADSPSVPRAELTAAKSLAQMMGIHHVILGTREFESPGYLRNAGDRCYYCKSELYDRILEEMPKYSLSVIVSGANLDDLGDYRPGLTAAAERHIRHPLQEAGFTKSDVRALALEWGLPVWDKPASPCLSSRLAPGLEVTPERTRRVENAEEFLRALGVKNCRVRYHPGDLARVEVPTDLIPRFSEADLAKKVVSHLQGLGFHYVTLDLEGLQSGSLNRLVSLELKTHHRGHS